MNEKQKKVMWTVLVIITLMALFPIKESGGDLRGRRFLYANKSKFRYSETTITTSAKVDLETLIAQMIPVFTIGGGIFISLKDKKDEPEITE